MNSTLDSKQQRKRAAAASKRYRQKIQEKQDTRHYQHRTLSQLQALLAAPFHQLSYNEKALVRYHRLHHPNLIEQQNDNKVWIDG